MAEHSGVTLHSLSKEAVMVRQRRWYMQKRAARGWHACSTGQSSCAHIHKAEDTDILGDPETHTEWQIQSQQHTEWSSRN